MRFVRTWGRLATPVTVADAIETVLSHEDGGQTEVTRAITDNQSRMLGQLVEMLHENGHLTDEQVTSFVRYRYAVAPE